ncbi:TPA: hypothetical protein U1X35_000997 [Streptococcus suis]|nr:hypothetical protein [Streptococcus suis]HEM4291339.1 hypothetical protein [Streptococcus suis]
MENLINFYDELNIAQSLSVEQIKRKLEEKKSVAISRLQQTPDISNRILDLVKQAFEVFSSETTKAKYDELLLQAPIVEKKVVDEDKVKFDMWLEKAANYYNEKQYDLAVTAMQKVFEFRKDDTEVDSLILAGWVYNDAHHYKDSLRYVNEALILRPENPAIYRSKYIAMYNLIFTGEEEMDKITAASKGNELETLLKNYLRYTEEIGIEFFIEEAKAFISGQYFYNLSGFIDRTENDSYYPLKLTNDDMARKGYGMALEVPESSKGKNVIACQSAATRYAKAKGDLSNAKLVDWGLLFNKFTGIVLLLLCVFLRSSGIFLSICIAIGLAFYIHSANSSYTQAKEAEESTWREIVKLYSEWKKM